MGILRLLIWSKSLSQSCQISHIGNWQIRVSVFNLADEGIRARPYLNRICSIGCTTVSLSSKETRTIVWWMNHCCATRAWLTVYGPFGPATVDDRSWVGSPCLGWSHGRSDRLKTFFCFFIRFFFFAFWIWNVGYDGKKPFVLCVES